MRRGNVASALQYVPELTWILFLRILDETEDEKKCRTTRSVHRTARVIAKAIPLERLGCAV